MGLIDANKIQDEIKKCDGVASDDYGKGIREGIRRALLRVSEAETVNTDEIRADERRRFAKWLEDNGYLHIVDFDYTKMRVRMKSRSVDAKTVVEHYES